VTGIGVVVVAPIPPPVAEEVSVVALMTVGVVVAAVLPVVVLLVLACLAGLAAGEVAADVVELLPVASGEGSAVRLQGMLWRTQAPHAGRFSSH